jgi:tRNA(Ile)-lysidine synthase
MVNAEQLEDKIYSYVREQNLFYPGEKVVVAVSGGADSVCLLHILNNLKSRLDITLHVAHFNHGLRGRESDSDARFVARLVKKLGLPLSLGSDDVEGLRKFKKISLEEAARETRYEFFADVAAKENGECVAVAHTRDDNVETILMHILRGSGMSGLRGLLPASVLQFGQDKLCLNVVRPLLAITRDEVEAYCRFHKIKPRVDSSNKSITFTRNRIRLQLLPVLRTYNPRVDEALIRLANIANEETSYLEEQAAQLWSEIAEEYGSAVSLDIKKIIHLPGIIQRQILLWAVKYLRGSTRDIEAFHVEDMIKFISKPAGKTLCLPQGLRLNTVHNQLILSRDEVEICPFPPMEEHVLAVPGETEIPGWVVKAEVLKNADSGFEGNFIARLDYDRTGKQLKVRCRQQGDFFQPLGMSQPKSLQKFMIDSKIPRNWRDHIPLVCNQEQVLWIVGWRIDDRYKVRPGTGKILRLEFQRIA